MKKKATARPAKAASRQSTLDFPTSSDADLIAESSAAVTSTKSGAKNRRKRTADFADDTDKHNETNGDASVPLSSAPTERNKIAHGKKRSAAAALGQHPSITESPEGATETSSSVKNRRKRTADFADDADKHNKSQCDSSAISAQSAVKHSRELLDLSTLPPLPMGWTWVVPSDVCQTVASGSTPKPTEMFSGNGEVPFLKVYNLTHTGHLDFTIKPTFISRATHEGMLGRSRTFPGDVLMNIVGPPLGKVSIVPDHFPKANINQAIVVFRVGPRLLPKYLAFALLTDSVLRRLTSKAKATAGQSNIGVGMCRSLLPIPLAPLPEQHRIVAEIEKQFTRLDAGVAALKRVQANLKRYRAAVLKAACEGKLVRTEAELARYERRTYETGEQLLQRILTERRQNWQGRGQYQEPAAAATSLPLLPEGWTWATAQQLNLANRPCAYGVLQPGEEVPDGVPFVRVGDINNGRVELANIKRISAVIAAQYPRTKLHGGELAITLVGAIGRTAIIPESLANGNTARAVGIIPLTKQVNAHWVEICFRNPAKRAEMESKSHEVARKTLNLEDVRVASVALPPLAEQIRIVAEVERCLSMVEELESVVVTNLQRAIHLRQSILQRAFIGEL